MAAGGKLSFTEAEIRALFGHEAAEDEDPKRLRQYYFKSQIFDQVCTDLSLRIVVGHKGIGKSALFKVAYLEDEEAGRLPIEVRPDDISAIGKAETDFLQRIRVWKQGLREIIADKVLARLQLADKITGESVSRKTGELLSLLKAAARPYIEDKVDLSALNPALVKQFLKSNQITVYMDDLDRGWQGSTGDIHRISALLNAVRDLSRENPGINFRIALRSDVYFLVRTSDESTDKVGTSVIWHSWTNHQILALLIKRIETYLGNDADERKLMSMSQWQLEGFLEPVFEEKYNGKGKWADTTPRRVMMSMIRRRPRDLVMLLTMAGRQAHDSRSPRIGTVEFESVFVDYSQERIQDTVNEYSTELPDIERLIFAMKPNKIERRTRTGFAYSTPDLLKKIRSIEEQGEFKSGLGKPMTTKQLAGFLYKINFLVASKERPDGSMDRKYFEENKYLSSEIVDFGYEWEVHPAYRWALQPDDSKRIFNDLALTEDGGEGKPTKPIRVKPPGSRNGR